MELVVPDDKLSLAIGKKGQNVRLASQLTGWRIDIHSETKVREMELRSKQSLASIEGVSAELAETFYREGWRSAAEIAGAKPDELASTVGGGDPAKAMIAAAAKAAEIERVRNAEEAARVAREAAALAEAGASATAAGGAAAGEAGATRGTEAR
jgi:N utilization substance protein A